MPDLDDFMSPERLKRLNVVYACVVTRRPGEYFLVSFADASRARVLDRQDSGERAWKWLKSSLDVQHSLLRSVLSNGRDVYVNGAPFGMAMDFMERLLEGRAPAAMLGAALSAVTSAERLTAVLTETRGLSAEVREAPEGYKVYLDGEEFRFGR